MKQDLKLTLNTRKNKNVFLFLIFLGFLTSFCQRQVDLSITNDSKFVILSIECSYWSPDSSSQNTLLSRRKGDKIQSPNGYLISGKDTIPFQEVKDYHTKLPLSLVYSDKNVDIRINSLQEYLCESRSNRIFISIDTTHVIANTDFLISTSTPTCGDKFVINNDRNLAFFHLVEIW